MKKTLQVINSLEKEGVIQGYAMGGATALLFYAEPALTNVTLFKKNGKNTLKKSKKTIENLFEEKKKRRQALAQLPIEEKIKILVRLQQIACPILFARGLRKEAWKL